MNLYRTGTQTCAKFNKHCEHQIAGTKYFRGKLVEEFKSRIKLDDTSLKFKEIKYYYWTKTTKKGNYSIMLRQRIDDKNNITEPGISRSAKIIGRFPSLEDLFTRIEDYENDTEQNDASTNENFTEHLEIQPYIKCDFIKIIAPIIPHIAEELWEINGGKESVF